MLGVQSVATLGLSMIVRNVSDRIERCLASILPFIDELVIVDTGSTDDSKSVISKIAPKAIILDFNEKTHPAAFLKNSRDTWNGEIDDKFTDEFFLADFGAARQFGWESVKSDFIIWIDSDDTLEGGENLKSVVADLQREGCDGGLLTYEYSFDSRGRPNCTLLRERVVKRGHGSWKQPVHEVLFAANGFKRYDTPKVVHHRHEYAYHGVTRRNLKILLHWWNQNAKTPQQNLDPRMLFYLGMEMQWIWPERACEIFRIYCERSGWDEERALAKIISGRLKETSGKYAEAFSEYAQAAIDFPDNPEGMFGCARAAYFLAKNNASYWQKVVDHTNLGFEIVKRIGDTPSPLMFDPADRHYRPYVYLATAQAMLERWQDVVETATKGLAWNPDDPFLKGNLEQAQKALVASQGEPSGMKFGSLRASPLEAAPLPVPVNVLGEFVLIVWKKLRQEGKYDVADKLLAAMPTDVGNYDRVLQAKTLRSKLDIVIWTGWAWEEWNPKNLITGIGGSEIAAISISHELVKRGHRVRVFGNCPKSEGVYDGVEYLHWERNKSAKTDVLIVSRTASALADPQFSFDAKTRLLWVHDVHCGAPEGHVPAGLARADNILCLSKWHREYFLSAYPDLPPDKVVVTRNGIFPSRFAEMPAKKNRLIYASSPDRGLMRLLDLFPKVREIVPDAELHVYYGFATWEEMARVRGDANAREQINSIKQKLSTTDGVILHGRVGQKELADAYLASKVLSYPTWFSETSCIAAAEAQAAGCVPVTTALAALNETVKHGVLLPPPDTSVEYGDAFVRNVIKLLCNDAFRESLAGPGRTWAAVNLGWDLVAAEWEKFF